MRPIPSRPRLAGLRDRLLEGLSAAIAGVSLNGPALRRTTCDCRAIST